MKTTVESLQDPTLQRGGKASVRALVFRDVGDQSLVLASQIVLNLSFFLVMLFASMRFEPANFLELTFANSLIPLIATALDFGLSQSCLALSFEHKKQDYVQLNLIVKAATLLLAAMAFVVAFMLSGSATQLVLVLAAASMSFWTATRVIEQYGRRFRRYAVLNFALAAARILLGLAAAIHGGWIALILAVHVVAQLPIQILTLSRVAEIHFKSVNWNAIKAVVHMAPITFFATSLFSALPLLTLWILNHKGDTLSAAAFGVVLMFLAPIDLLFATLKVYLFPKIVETDFKNIDLFGLGTKSMYVMMGTLTAILVLGLIPASFIIDLLYDKRFPEADRFFVTYFSCHALACVIGVYTMRSQRPGFVRLALIANFMRAAGTTVLIIVPNMTSYQVVLWSGIIVVAGEFVLVALLRVHARGKG
ncbi:hypothetical protein [Microvirga sesbaniae]|uniref:hypothetical protein n=1 Tax=Microvirga sesbaniae TaxID=681392 RepID=UPI0021C910D0|nr:hypothetical protein [Microvirga sp. HBU67692]